MLYGKQTVKSLSTSAIRTLRVKMGLDVVDYGVRDEGKEGGISTSAARLMYLQA